MVMPLIDGVENYADTRSYRSGLIIQEPCRLVYHVLPLTLWTIVTLEL